MATAWYDGPVPDGMSSARLRLVPLTEAHAHADLDAVLASADYLRRWSDSGWPEPGFGVDENRIDLRRHRQEHEQRIAFTFSVQPPELDRVLGCIYIHPLDRAFATRDIDVGQLEAASLPRRSTAVVRGWIRTDEPPGLLDELVAETMSWLSDGTWHVPDVWWQASERTRDQLAACERARLTRRIDVPGSGTTWQLRAR